MKPIGYTLLCLFAASCAQNTPTLEYVLRVIEYMSGAQAGTFSCIFYDIAPRPPFDNILNDLLKSPQLDHVIKYIVNGTNQDRLQNLPKHPSMLVMHPGNNLSHLERTETVRNMDSILWQLDPATKVLVIVNNSYPTVLDRISAEIKAWHFTNVIYVDEDANGVRLSNSAYYVDLSTMPHPKRLYSYLQRRLKGRNISFFHDNFLEPTSEHYLWVTEVARYLNTKAVQYRHHCENLSETAHARCMSKQKTQLDKVDINMNSNKALILFDPLYRGFNIFFTNIPLISRIVVPRDRQLHPAELMLLPFSWQLWTVLLAVLISAELCKQLIPGVLKNDPILFVVCGFERHNLHTAGRWERIILQALVVLMFFASNAYETKIISLMINQPSAQRIKTLEDAAAAGIKFYTNLAEFPWQRNNSVVGKLLVDEEMSIYDAFPGVGMLVSQDTADISDVFAFDYARGQPWYVLLEDEFFTTCVVYSTAYRSPLLEVFGYVHNAMLEAGIWNLWKRRYQHLIRGLILSSRPKVNCESTIYLDFEDMQLAWIVLAIGFFAGSIGFAGELVRKRFGSIFKFRKSFN